MGTVTKTFIEPGTGGSTWTVNISCDDVVVSGATFNIYDLLSSTAKYVNTNRSLGAVSNKFQFTIADYTSIYNYQWFSKGSGVNGTDPMTSNVFYPISKSSTYGLTTIYTSWVFNSNNSTSRTANIEVYSTKIYLRSAEPSWYYDSSYSNDTTVSWGIVATVTLDVPPTATVSAISYDTGYIYAGLTTASIDISDATAYYGGTIDSVEFKIGNQTATAAGDGTLSIALDTPGTFTPTVTITDSRGQTKTYTLDPITVNTYTAPTISFDVDRTNASGTPDDEGTYGFIEAILTFSDAVASAVAPSVVLTDENGTQTTPVVSWYTDNALTTPVVWANVSSGDTIYGIFSGLNTNYSYTVSVRPRDSEGTGTAITQTISAAFYTVDFLAGGHGIAFGQPSSQPGFYCNMDAHFVDANSTMRALFDFIYPVGSYYETSDTTFDPNVTWGGTWALETEGQVHISAGANYTVAGALTDTTDGGEATHLLTSAESALPKHNHTFDDNVGAWTTPMSVTGPSRHTIGSGSGAANMIRSANAITRYPSIGNKEIATATDAHNNMQPYIIVNRWHRTA